MALVVRRVVVVVGVAVVVGAALVRHPVPPTPRPRAGVVRGGAGARGGREEEGRGWGREREAGQRERVDFVKEPKENQHDFSFLEGGVSLSVR